MASILIIDDEDKYLELCRRHLPEHRFFGPARSLRDARALLRGPARQVDLVLLDLHFDIDEAELVPKESVAAAGPAPDRERILERLRRTQGLHILDALRPEYPSVPVVLMTSRDDLPTEADAERLRAENYTYLLEHEYLDARSLRLQVEGILAETSDQRSDDEPFFWGTSAAMSALRRRISVLAKGQLPMIILGETGTGKSLLAREYVHAQSGRTGEFIAVDLSTVPTELMAAHLFGVVRGAYTGASASREGVLDKADGGTLFLDEIGNLSLDLQKSLLLVLQERRFRPVGAIEERTVDLKLVVATNEDLGEMVRDGRFREDLYMRLNPATAIVLPSLRDRREDFGRVLESFVRRVCKTGYNRDLLERYAEQRGLLGGAGRPGLRVSLARTIPARREPGQLHLLMQRGSVRLLEDYHWPGNFRQLEMVLSNVVTFTLVDLVEQGSAVEPGLLAGEERPDVLVVQPRTVAELLMPWDRRRRDELEPEPEGQLAARVSLKPSDSLNALACDVERQYLESCYLRFRGDLGQVAARLLGNAEHARKIQLRMNQLGIKLRELKLRLPGAGTDA